jgi:predicted transcriptional regulator
MNKKDIPAAELEVLACLKKLRAATAREIREIMAPFRPMAHGSVVTLLARLEAKKLITKKKGSVGKAFVYTTTDAAGMVYRNALHKFLHRIFAGDAMTLVASIFETKPPNPKQIEELEQMIAGLKAKARRM